MVVILTAVKDVKSYIATPDFFQLHHLNQLILQGYSSVYNKDSALLQVSKYTLIIMHMHSINMLSVALQLIKHHARA